MNEKIRVLIVDDQMLFREGLQTLLNAAPDIEVIAECSNGEEAVRTTANLRPDVVLMDMRMPVLDGASATKRILQARPETRVIVLTTFDDDEDIFKGLRAGAVGYLLKDVPSSKLYEAIRAAARGEYFLLPSITARVVNELTRRERPASAAVSLVDPLSNRELEILNLVSDGLSNKEIADKLVIAEGTVKNHLTSILAKLNARDRTQAVAFGRQAGLIGG